jgi:hypothetical protein
MISLRNLVCVGVEVEQDARRDAFVLAHEAEQDVLGADVVVAEAQRFAQRELQDLLRARRERDLPRRDLVTLADDACDLRAHFLDRDVERLEHARGEPFLFAQQPEQDVLRADVVVLERPCLVLGEDDDLPCPFGEAFEQLRPSFLAGRVIVAQLAAAMSRGFTGSLLGYRQEPGRPYPGFSASRAGHVPTAEVPVILAALR